MSAREAQQDFACFGSRATVIVEGDGPDGSAEAAALGARRTLLEWHDRFTRFEQDSELSLLNADERETVPVTALMARFASSVVRAGSMSRGLVDATLLEEIRSAGYGTDIAEPLGLTRALALAPRRAPAGASSSQGWTLVSVDEEACTITRPPGVMLDSGGIAKGMFADVIAEQLSRHPAFAVNCAGDLALGGSRGVPREIKVESPFDGSTLHTFTSPRTGVATSGIGRRSWLGTDGLPAHHLLDPATGRPAFTGVVQVTALDPEALAAEVRAKAAILSGPARAGGWLTHGGVIVFDDGSHQVVAPPPSISLSDLSGFADAARTHAGKDG